MELREVIEWLYVSMKVRNYDERDMEKIADLSLEILDSMGRKYFYPVSIFVYVSYFNNKATVEDFHRLFSPYYSEEQISEIILHGMRVLKKLKNEDKRIGSGTSYFCLLLADYYNKNNILNT